MYQLNVSCGAAGAVAEYLIYLTVQIPSGPTKVVKVIDFYAVNLNYYENASWSGTYYFPANTLLNISSGAANVAQASFSGFLVRRT
jgi:hypothetical protein